MARPFIEFDGDEIQAACSWHGGQSSMLYAVCSTGTLALGTQRPYDRDEDRPMTDEEWFSFLLDRLDVEVSRARRDALKMQGEAEDDSEDDSEMEELAMNIEAFDAMLLKIEKARHF